MNKQKPIFLSLLFLCSAHVHATDLNDVLDSIDENHPKVQEQVENIEAARSGLLASEGSFDTQFESGNQSYLSGFYSGSETYSRIAQPIPFMNSEVFTEYRIGRGEHPVYEDELQTLNRGEAGIGIAFSLLRDRETDKRRTRIELSKLSIEEQELRLRESLLNLYGSGADIFWDWRIQAAVVNVVERLISAAEKRVDFLKERVRTGAVAEIELLDNRRALLARQEKLLDEKAKFAKLTQDLSIFLRDSEGAPLKPALGEEKIEVTRADSKLKTRTIPPLDVMRERRPDLLAFDVELESLQAKMRLSETKLLPRLDVKSSLTQDYGSGSESREGDEWKLGAFFEIPLQRREARGEVAQVKAKMRAVRQKIRLLEDKILAEAKLLPELITQIGRRTETLQRELKAAKKLEEAEIIKFKNGDSNLLFVTLRELMTAEVETRLLRAFGSLQKLYVRQSLLVGERPTEKA